MQFFIEESAELLLLQPQQQLPTPELLLPFFSGWLKSFSQLSQLQAEQGLDWLHIRFYFHNAAFALHYEHYSDSCWVDADNATAAVLLSDLASLLRSS
ncbi:DUF3630 family protein [Rheinheimera sp.]|uniref:DUF3630 family protein n=1 Tax=Rheinheimera sp. TaxID=1869214 RepID=UPI0027B8E488|nr:DUF3630 family protein [Rheinheimera sp.]